MNKESRSVIDTSRRRYGTLHRRVSRAFLVLVLVFAVVTLSLVSAGAEDKLRVREAIVDQPYAPLDFRRIVTEIPADAVWSVEDTNQLPQGFQLSNTGVLTGQATEPIAKKDYEFRILIHKGGNEVFRFVVQLPLRAAKPALDAVRLGAAGASIVPTGPPPACTPTPSQFVLATSTADEETIALTEDVDFDTTNIINTTTLKITNPDALINETLENTPPAAGAGPLFLEGDYCVIHIVRWKQVHTEEDKSDPEKEVWALFERVNRAGSLTWVPRLNPDDNEVFDTRIFGHRRVAVLALSFDTPKAWDIKYKVTINRRLPQPIQNVLQLASLIATRGLAGCPPVTTRNLWGGRLIRLRHLPSDVIVKLNTVTSKTDGQQISQSKEYSNTYLNEGKYHWDVSVGMPLKTYRDLEFSVENGVVTAKNVDRFNAYGFLNFYPRAVDLNSNSYLSPLHLVFGVPISGKPLDRPFVGLGVGVYKTQVKFNLFAGVVFNKVREPNTLAIDSPATSGQLQNDLETRRVTKFLFGINFPVKQFVKALGAN